MVLNLLKILLFSSLLTITSGRYVLPVNVHQSLTKKHARKRSLKVVVHRSPYDSYIINEEKCNTLFLEASNLMASSNACAVDTAKENLSVVFKLLRYEEMDKDSPRSFSFCEFKSFLNNSNSLFNGNALHLWIFHIEHDLRCSPYDFQGFFIEVGGVKHICLNVEDVFPDVFVHEFGHAFGLLHTWEDSEVDLPLCGFEGNYHPTACKNFMNIGDGRCYFLPYQVDIIKENLRGFKRKN
jgi:hypothetical protein